MWLVRFTVLLLTLIGFITPAFAEDVTFTGLVTWRERMTLPPESSLIISLVALPGEARITGAHAGLDGEPGSPIQFTLNVRSDTIADGGDYGLVAEIWSYGYIIFRNWQPVPVDVAKPSGILIPVEFSPPPPHDPPPLSLPLEDEPFSPLQSLTFMVTSIGGDPVLADTRITLNFAADAGVSGQAGCNRYFTEADYVTTPLSFGPVAGTRMACAPAVMDQETRFFAALAATRGYEFDETRLHLLDAAGLPLVGLIQTP